MRKGIAAAFVAGSLLTGGAIGTAFFGPGTAGAQTSSSSDSQSSQSSQSTAPPNGAPAPPDGRRFGRHGGPHHLNLSVAASTIGISDTDLRTALQSGQSIADVAKAHSVDPQTVIDALVADAKQHLADDVSNGRLTQGQADQISADLATHITDEVNHAGLGGPGGPGCPGMGDRPAPGAPGAPGSNSSSSDSGSSSTASTNG